MFERCLYFNTNALVRQINRIWKEAYAELHLSPSHAYLLRLVLAQPGLSQIAIADELRLERSTVTRFLDKMESEGYVERRIEPNRQTRELNIYPTEKATEIHERLEEIGALLYGQMVATIGESALPSFVGEIREVTELFSNGTESVS